MKQNMGEGLGEKRRLGKGEKEWETERERERKRMGEQEWELMMTDKEWKKGMGAKMGGREKEWER